MRYDLHVHSSPLSPCASNSPEDMCRAALECGLAGIAFTEHDMWWPPDELQTLQILFLTLTILAGAEVTCPEGHFVVFVPRGGEFKLKINQSVMMLTKEVHSRNGILIWVHPFRFDAHIPPWLKRTQLDGIEVASTNINENASVQSSRVAETRGLIAFRNSDAHHIKTLGTYWNEFPQVICKTEDLILFCGGFKRSLRKFLNVKDDASSPE